MRQILWLAAALLAVPACISKVPSTNPYDPDTPVDQQQKATLTGTVSGTSGLLSGAEITLSGPTAAPNSPLTTTDDGAFNFGELTPGTYALDITHATHFSYGRDLVLGPGEARVIDITLLERGGDDTTAAHVTGVAQRAGQLVLDATLQDHSAIIVEVVGTGVRTVTNRQGVYDLFLTAGTYDLTFDASEYNQATRTGVVAVAGQTVTVPDSPVVLQPNPGEVTGLVTLEGRDPAAAVHGDVVVSLLGTSATTQTAPDGSFRLDGVAAGTYTLSASYSDATTTFVTATQVVVVHGGAETQATPILLSIARGAVAGRITLEGEASHTQVTVEAVGSGLSALTDDNGDFLISGLPAGTYSIRGSKIGFVSDEITSVQVSVGETTSVGPLQLAVDPGTVSGVVRLEGQSSHSGTALSLTGPRSYAETTAVDGSFAFSAVRAGIYTLTATADGFADAAVLGVTVGAGSATVIPDLTLAVPRGHIQGQVVLTDNNSALLSSVVVLLKDTGGATVSSTAAKASGAYGFKDVPIGTYDVVATLVGYTSARVDDVTVNAQVTENVSSLTLSPKTGEFDINEAPYTNSTRVTLTLDNTLAVGMRLSEDGTFGSDSDPYVTYISAPSFFLSAGDGQKTLFVQYCEGASFTSDCSVGTPSAVFSASVTLDETPPTVSLVEINDGDEFTNDAAGTVSLRVVANDSGSGLRDMKVSNDTTFDETPVDYTAIVTPGVANPLVDGVKTIYVVVRDFAGNTSAAGNAFSGAIPGANNDSIELDRAAPVLSGVEIECNGVQPATHCNTPLVTIHLSPIDPEPTTTVALSNTGTFTGATFLPFAATSSWLLLPTDGTRQVSVMLRDAAGNATGGTDSASVVLDQQVPTLLVKLEGTGKTGPDTSLVRSTTVTVNLTAVDETSGASALQMRISNYGNFTSDGSTPLPWVAYDTQTLFHPLLDTSLDGLKRVYAQVRDEAGNIATGEGTVTFDGSPPTLASVSFPTTVTKESTAVLSIDAPGATEMEITGDLTDSFAAGFVPLASPVTVTLANTNLDNRITVAVRDDAGNVPSAGSLAAMIYRDTLPPQDPLVTINGGDTYTDSAAVLLQFATSDEWTGYGVEEVAVAEGSIDCATADYQPYVDSLPWQLFGGDGDHNVHACFRDAAGNAGSASATIEQDEQPPTAVSVVINGTLADAAATPSTSVTSTASVSYTIAATDDESGLWQMWLSFDPSFATGAWETFATTKPDQTLTPATGTETVTVYLRVRDFAGNVTESSGNILLDTEPPIVGALVPQGDYVTGSTVDLTLSASGASQMCFYGTGVSGGSTDDCAANGWETYAASKRLDLTTGEGAKAIEARFRDSARNTVNAAGISVTRDGTAPSLSGATVTVTGVAGSGDPTAITRVANVTVAFTGETDATSPITDMMLSEDSGFSGAVWQTVTSSFQWVLSGGDGAKEVYIKLRDAAGNATTGYMTGTITLDQTAPTGVSFSLDDPEDSDDDYAKVQGVTGVVAATGAAQVCLNGQLTNGSADGCSTDGWVAYTISLPVSLTATSGSKAVALFARDAAGNVASPVVDSIYLDTIPPSTTEIVSISPRTTSVFLDLSAATDSESGVDGYAVDYQVVGDSTWSTVSFSTDQGTVSGLAAPRVFRFRARAVDRAGNLGNDSVSVDRLVGLSASMVEGFDNIAAFGDRVYSARGHVFFPRMIDETTLVMLSCDARRSGCSTSGLQESVLDLSAAGCTDIGGFRSDSFDVAMAQQGKDLWLFGLCETAVSGTYHAFAYRSPFNPNELGELDHSISSTNDATMWRYVDLGTHASAGNYRFGETASATANGIGMAFAYFENRLTPRLVVRMCGAGGDCTGGDSSVGGGFESVSLTYGANDLPLTYTDMDGGEQNMWLVWGAGDTSSIPTNVVLTGCNASAADCTVAGNWSRVNMPGVTPDEIASVRVLEAGSTVYVWSLQAVSGVGGVYLWTCDVTTGCGSSSDFIERGSISAPAIDRIEGVVFGTRKSPRLSVDYAEGYLYYSSIDYLDGNVGFARCKLSTGCALITDWTPVDVLETSSVSGQADLAVVAGNPTVYVGRDDTRAYLLEPYTPAPVGRALLPDLDAATGGVRACLAPVSPDVSEGYSATYNTTGFLDPLDTEVLSFSPSVESFTVTTDDTQVFGTITSFRGDDTSLPEPYFSTRASAPGELAALARFLRYDGTADCHVLAYVEGTDVVVQSCTKTGDCSNPASYSAQTIMTLPAAAETTDMAMATQGSTVRVAVAGNFADPADNINIRHAALTLSGTCVPGTPTTATDIYSGAAWGTWPDEASKGLAMVATASNIYVSHAVGDATLAGPYVAQCSVASGCNADTDWSTYGFTEDEYFGGDMVIGGNRLFWVYRSVRTGASGTTVRSCDTATLCNAVSDWQPEYWIRTSSDPLGSGSLNLQNDYLLWVQENDMAWCDLTQGCSSGRDWNWGGVVPDYLSTFDMQSGVLGRHNNGLIYVGIARGGVYTGRCNLRCWDSDNWSGGFVGRSSQYTAEIWERQNYNHWGRYAGIDPATGDISIAYRYLASTDPPDLPSLVRLNTNLRFELQLAP